MIFDSSTRMIIVRDHHCIVFYIGGFANAIFLICMIDAAHAIVDYATTPSPRDWRLIASYQSDADNP